MRVDNRVLKNAVLNCRFYTVAQASGAILPVWHAMADSICNCRGCQLWGALAFGEPLPSSCFSNSHHGSSVHPCPGAQPQSSAEASSSTSVDASHPKLECVQPQSSAAASSSTAVDASHLPASAEPPSDQKTQMHPMAPDWWSAFKHPEFPRSRRHLDPDFTTARRMTTMPVLRPTQVRDDLNAEKNRLRQGNRFPVLHRVRFRLPLASGLRRHWATTCCVCLCRHFAQSCMALEALRGLSEHDSSLPILSQDVSSQRCMGWECVGHGAPPATENAPAF